MTQDGADTTIRQAIGGDQQAMSRIVAQGATSDDAVVITVAALLEGRSARLDRAAALAATTRDRQVVAIARAHLDGNDELVDAFARDHLVDYPDSLIVSWIASDGVARSRRRGSE
jgi:hypothetical protein